MTLHYTTTKAVQQATNNQSGEGEIAMLKNLHNAEMEAAARAKAKSLNLGLAVVSLGPEWPGLMRYRFYRGGVETHATTDK